MIVEYTALRSLAAGTNSGDLKTVNIALSEFARSSKSDTETTWPLQGSPVTLKHNSYVTYRCRTQPNRDQDHLMQIREFLDSVDAGETFSITYLESPWANIALPATAMLWPISYDEEPISYQLLSYSFTIRFL